MAERREAEKRTAGTILADSRGARKRFGFGGAPESAITTAPKFADQWFIEFTDPSGNVKDISAQAQSVSPITINTTTQPIDRYGKREYIPTRVDFPEVTVTLYDTVDGATMVFAQDIYARFFKNSTLQVDAGNMTSTIEDINSGRKLPGGETGNATNPGLQVPGEPSTFNTKGTSTKNFEKVTVYHFFGSFDGGEGKIQRIVLINPVVTSITFSESDYAASALRTISITLQPENVVFGAPQDNPAVPQWMQEGLEFILEDLSTNNTDELIKNLRNRLKIGQDIDKTLEQKEADWDAIQSMRTEVNAMMQQKKLADLNKFYQQMKKFENDKNATDEEKAQAISDFMEARYEMSPVAVRSSMTETAERQATSKIAYKPTDLASQQQTANQLHEAIMQQRAAEEREAAQIAAYRGRAYNQTQFQPSVEIPDTFVNNNNSFSSGTLNPGVNQGPQIGGSNYTSQVGGDFYGSGDLASSIRNELVTAFFNGRKVDFGNVRRDVVQGILGNSGLGNLYGAQIGSKSRFGVAGDLIRDSLINNSRVSNNAQPVGSVNRQNTQPQQPRDIRQNAIQSIGNRIRNLLR